MTATTMPTLGRTEGVGRRAGRFVRAELGLFVTPLLIAAAALALWYHVDTADKIFQDESALDWDSNLYPLIRQHLALTFWSTLWVLVIAIPLGVVLTRPQFRRYSGPILTVANSGQALPAYGLFVIAFAWQGRGFSTAVMALTFFALLPVLRNTMVGLDQVDPALLEAGKGMGMSRLQVLRRIEMPLAVPVILAGVRTALVITVGMAALAYLIGGGGLGATISAGLKLSRDLVLITGAVMTALVALTVDWIAALIEKTLRPSGL